MVDAAGAIYVLSGRGDTFPYYQDVWASTDGGALPDSVGGGRGVLVLGVTTRVLPGCYRGTMGK